jgi:hypothetical protein
MKFNVSHGTDNKIFIEFHGIPSGPLFMFESRSKGGFLREMTFLKRTNADKCGHIRTIFVLFLVTDFVTE